MGYNTTILLMNDGLDQLESDPDAGKKIQHAVLRQFHEWSNINSFGIGNHVNMGQVISCQHADTQQVCMVSRNLGKDIANHPTPDRSDLEWLAQFLKSHGYRVSRPKEK